MVYEYLFSLLSIYLIVAVAAGVHVLLHKRNSRAAFGWLALIIVFPIAGALLYALFGINRVRRKALRVSRDAAAPAPAPAPVRPARAAGAGLEHAGYHVIRAAPFGGNHVSSLYNGEEAFPAMLRAIDEARREVLISTYIFDADDSGRHFLDALVRARARGCTVCVLVDDVGIRYSFPTIVRELKRCELVYRRFMPLRVLPPSFSINLRTHRKLLIADRMVGFAGGMNIGDRQLLQGTSRHRASDLHFCFKGPVVGDMLTLFAEDWQFAGGEPLERWTAEAPASGAARCRLIPDGPDETIDSLIRVIMGAVSAARQRVWIMTPYFLPERQLMGCLQAAALSGVDVRIMIPQKNNWPLVQWALQHNMTEMLDTGIQIVQRPPPFAHSKCLLIDDDYTLVGSSNLDPRSLRLNFELGIEIFDGSVNHELSAHFEQVAADCVPFTPEQLAQRGYAARLRDATAALFSPYL
jgi:cardiolipin synthase